MNKIIKLTQSQKRLNDVADACETLQAAQEQYQQLNQLFVDPEIYYRRQR